jgi:hypothetical protein
VTLIGWLLLSAFSASGQSLDLLDLHPVSLGSGRAFAVVKPEPAGVMITSAYAGPIEGITISGLAGLKVRSGGLLGLSSAVRGGGPETVLLSVLGNGEQLTVGGGASIRAWGNASLGLLLVYATESGLRGMSLDIGAHLDGRWLDLGLTARHLGSSLLGGPQSADFGVGALISAARNLELAVAVRFLEGLESFSFGAQTALFGANLFWGVAVAIGGGFKSLGVGVEFSPFDVPLAVAVGMAGEPLQLCASIRSMLHIPMR